MTEETQISINKKPLTLDWTGREKSKDMIHSFFPKGYAKDEQNMLDEKTS